MNANEIERLLRVGLLFKRFFPKNTVDLIFQSEASTFYIEVDPSCKCKTKKLRRIVRAFNGVIKCQVQGCDTYFDLVDEPIPGVSVIEKGKELLNEEPRPADQGVHPTMQGWNVSV